MKALISHGRTLKAALESRLKLDKPRSCQHAVVHWRFERPAWIVLKVVVDGDGCTVIYVPSGRQPVPPQTKRDESAADMMRAAIEAAVGQDADGAARAGAEDALPRPRLEVPPRQALQRRIGEGAVREVERRV